jgi:hypothetical protein
MELLESAEKEGVTPVFGLNYKFLHSGSEDEKNWHKIIIFIKNNRGYKDLIKIHNAANLKNSGSISSDIFKEFWTDNLKLAIPFYDSFIFRNTMYDGLTCLPEFGDVKPTYFTEDNGLPFDDLIESKINGEKIKVKSIFYEKEEDFIKWQTYRCSLNFSNKGKNRTLGNPMFDHCHSNKFSFESYIKAC